MTAQTARVSSQVLRAYDSVSDARVGRVSAQVLRSLHPPYVQRWGLWTPLGASGSAYKDAVLALSPWAFWLCDEASGSLADSSGNGRSMTVYNTGSTVTYQTSGPGGSSGVDYGILWPESPFDQTHYAEADSTVSWSTVTIAGLIFVPSSETDAFHHMIFGFASTYGSTTSDKLLYLDSSDKLTMRVFAGSAQIIAGTTGLSRGDWHHVAGVVGPTEKYRLYVDGAEIASNTGVSTSATASMKPLLRAGGTLNSPAIDAKASRPIATAGMAIWNDELTSTEIASLSTAAGL